MIALYRSADLINSDRGSLGERVERSDLQTGSAVLCDFAGAALFMANVNMPPISPIMKIAGRNSHRTGGELDCFCFLGMMGIKCCAVPQSG